MAGGPAFAVALEARVARFQGEVRAELHAWERARGDRWDEVATRVRALTLRLRLAQGESRRRFATTAAGGGRERARRVLGWMIDFDRERARIEDEIWGVLRTARADEAARRAQMAARGAELDGLGRRLAREAEAALTVARAAGDRTPAQRALDERLAAAHAALARALEAATARARADVERLGARSFPDFAQALARLDAELAAGLADGGAPVPPRGRLATGSVPPRPPGPPRKRARVPRFVLDRFYRVGGLRVGPDGAEITFVNPLGFCIIQGGDPVVIDGRPFPRARTVLDNGERRLGGEQLCEASYLKFPRGAELRVVLDGLKLSPGRHRVHFALELRKMGWVDLDLEDATR